MPVFPTCLLFHAENCLIIDFKNTFMDKLNFILSDQSLNFYFVFQKYKKLAESDKLDEFLLLTNNFSVPLILKGGICYFPGAFVQS